jgi:hypothetical protein
MTHCTVCGAASREGARFCTSCGARLVETTATIETIEPSAPEEARDEQPGAEDTWTSTVTGDANGAVEILPAEPAEPPATVAETPGYSANWPAPDDDPATADAPAEEDPTPAVADDATTGEVNVPPPPGTTWSSWSTAIEGPVSEPTELEPAEAPDAGTNLDAGMEASHHGASQWESWAPEASGAATVPASGSDTAASVRRLLDDLATRIDRLIAPASAASRGVDADELADQLDRWSRAGAGSAGLLEVVQAVRKAPRDVDALTRLADRAPDLELLVRHYQAITSGAGDWARKLREQQPSDSDDA